MNELTQQKFPIIPPFKSVAVALLFCIVLGPIGLLYSSVAGGVVMMMIGLLIVRTKLMGLVLLTWLISCVWGVAAVNKYNTKIIRMRL